MEKPTHAIVRALPALLQNTHLEVILEGWPAATAIVAVCGTAVAIASILVSARKGNPG